MKQIFTALTVLFAVAAAGAYSLWTIGVLGVWRQIPYDAIQNSMYRYLLIVGLTGAAYRFARVYVGISMEKPNALERSRWWRLWAYVRWILASALIALLLAAWTPGGAGFFNDGVSESVRIHSAVEFLKGYSALLIVGLVGTYVGVQQAALKKEELKR